MTRDRRADISAIVSWVENARRVPDGDDEAEAKQALAVARFFSEHKRELPAHLKRRLWQLRELWQHRSDVPESVIEACRSLDVGAAASDPSRRVSME